MFSIVFIIWAEAPVLMFSEIDQYYTLKILQTDWKRLFLRQPKTPLSVPWQRRRRQRSWRNDMNRCPDNEVIHPMVAQQI